MASGQTYLPFADNEKCITGGPFSNDVFTFMEEVLKWEIKLIHKLIFNHCLCNFSRRQNDDIFIMFHRIF